jgi:hypothetical protein
MKPDPRDIREQRLREMEAERCIAWSPSLKKWCVCNGFAKILATANTREEAEKLKTISFAEQLKLF